MPEQMCPRTAERPKALPFGVLLGGREASMGQSLISVCLISSCRNGMRSIPEKRTLRHRCKSLHLLPTAL